jgi:CDP-diacylglycerol--glycerol-3-phosphate 3-phosphatidyltransferase
MSRLVRHLPNILTVARAAALPFIVWTYALSHEGAAWTTAWIVLFAALSDVADGLIARRFDVQSEFGRWVDPIVDRVFFFVLVAMLWFFGTLPWWAVVPLLVRDGIILALAGPMRRYTDQGPQVSRWGKAGNFVLICAIQWFIIDVRVVGWAFWAVGATLYVAVGLLYGYRALAWASGERHGAGERGGGAPS